MNHIKKQLFTLIVAALTVFAPMDLFSKGFSSSRSSFGGSRSSSFSSSRSSSSGFSSSKSTSKPSSSGFSSSKSSAVTPSKPSGFSSSQGGSSSVKPSTSSSTAPKTAFDKAAALRSITPPKPKDSYVNEFKSKNASKYPSTFSTQPATRPSYIPPKTTVNGKEREIQYNPTYGGYGFFDDLGKFMIYDAITDIALDSFKKDEVRYVTQVQEVEKKAQQAEQSAATNNVQNAENQKNDEGVSGKTVFALFLGGIAILSFLLFVFWKI